MTIQSNLSITAGTTEVYRAEVLNDDGTTADTTNLKPIARFGKRNGAAATLELVLDKGITIEDGAFVLTLSADDTAKLENGCWQLDVINTVTNQITRLYAGALNVTGQLLGHA